MRRAHSLIVLVSFLAAVAFTGCGIASYTALEARDATWGTTSFLFEDDRDYTGDVTVRTIDGPGQAIDVTFRARHAVMPELRDVQVSLGWDSRGLTFSAPPEAMEVHAASCSLGSDCRPIEATAVPIPGARPRREARDDLQLTITYTKERPTTRPVKVVRQVNAHPVRVETHHYPWILRDC